MSLTNVDLKKVIDIIEFIIENDPCDPLHNPKNWTLKNSNNTSKIPNKKSADGWYVGDINNCDEINRILVTKGKNTFYDNAVPLTKKGVTHILLFYNH